MNTEVSKVLDENGVTGKMLIGFSEEELVELKINSFQAKFIKKLVPCQPSNDSTSHQQPSKTPTKKGVQQEARQSGKPAGNIKYTLGNLIEHEVGGSVNLLEPAREWKSFDEVDFINTCELSFIEKVAKFSNACLNRRCNGTIYFGVKDKNSFTKAGNECRQGEITGIQVKEDEVSEIEDWMAKYFRGTNPICYKNVNNDEVKMGVTASIGRVRVIPVNGVEDRIVIEVDIEPSTENCKELSFPVYLPDIESHKIGKVVSDQAFIIREGPSSDKVTKKKDIDDLRKLRIPAYANTRAKQETQKILKFGSLNVKLKELFCKRESYINSEDTKFIGCIDKLSGNLDEKEFIGWISKIGWHADYDFDGSKEIGKTTDEMIRQVNTFDVEEFA